MDQIIDVTDPMKHFAYHLVESDYWRKGKRSTTVLPAQEVNMQTLSAVLRRRVLPARWRRRLSLYGHPAR